MGKFCRSCGEPLQDGAAFCTKCGILADGVATPPAGADDGSAGGVAVDTAVAAGSTGVAKMQTAEQTPLSRFCDWLKSGRWKKKKNTLLGALAVVIGMVILGTLLSRLYTPYEKPLESLCAAVNKGDSDKVLKVLPDDVADALELQMKDELGDVDEKIEDYKQVLEQVYGKNPELSFQVIGKDKLGGDQIDSITDSYHKVLNVELDIAKAYALDVRFILESEDGNHYGTYNLTVAKVDGEWSVIDVNYILSDYMDYVKSSVASSFFSRIQSQLDGGGYDDEYE